MMKLIEIKTREYALCLSKQHKSVLLLNNNIKIVLKIEFKKKRREFYIIFSTICVDYVAFVLRKEKKKKNK